MTYKEAVEAVARELEMPQQVIDKAYKAFWKAAREHIVSLPLKEALTDEEFLKLKTSVNIPSLGKLGVTLDRYKAIKERYNNFKEKKDVTY